MKRWLIAAGLTVLLIATLVATLPLLVSTDIAKDRIAAVLSDWLGARVAVAGQPHVTLSSGLRVVLPRVRAHDPAQGLSAEFDSVEAEVRLLPLLSGRIELSRFVLRRPQIVADAGAPVFAIAALRSDPDRWPFATSDLRIEQGSFTIRRADGEEERIGDIRGTLAWPGAHGEASVAASFVWRGETLELRAGLSDTAVFSGSGKASLNLSLTSTPLRINFEGVLLGPSDLQANGLATIAVPNLRRLLAWSGRAQGEGATLGPFSIDGEVKANVAGVVVNGATIELDGNVGTGILAANWRGARPSLQGTLDFEQLDLSGYVAESIRAEGAGDAIPIGDLAAADIDLQVSARQIRVGATRIGPAAASLLVNDGNLALEIAEAAFYDGNLSARLSATTASAAPGADMTVVGELTARDIDLAALPLEEWKIRPSGGLASADVNFTASGATPARLVKTLAGKLEGSVHSLVLDGFDLANAIDTFAAATGERAPGTGRTMLETTTLAAEIDAGVMSFTRIAAAGGGISVVAEGRASLPDQTIGLTGMAARAGPPEKALPFLVRGPLTAPQFLPDVNRLIDPKKVEAPSGPPVAVE